MHRSKFDPLTLRDLLRLVDARAIDILHLHGYGATTFGRLVGFRRGIPTIVHEHANLTDTPWFQRVADGLLAPATDIALAVSRSTADFLISARKIPPSKVRVVYLGVPLEDFSRPRTDAEVNTARRELEIRPGEFAVGTVTRLHESKGNSYLVDAASLVVKDRPHARFFLVGEGPLLGDLQAQAARLGLGDRCVFAGFRRDVAQTLSAFDLCVFPSSWEGTPITAFEALAMGKPIVSTDADGLLDILTDDQDAVIVPRRNAEALARKIVSMIDHPAERGRLALAARQSGRRYDIDVFVQKMERLYTLLHQHAKGSHRHALLDADLSFLTAEGSAR